MGSKEGEGREKRRAGVSLGSVVGADCCEAVCARAFAARSKATMAVLSRRRVRRRRAGVMRYSSEYKEIRLICPREMALGARGF